MPWMAAPKLAFGPVRGPGTPILMLVSVTPVPSMPRDGQGRGFRSGSAPPDGPHEGARRDRRAGSAPGYDRHRRADHLELLPLGVRGHAPRRVDGRELHLLRLGELRRHDAQ